MIDRSINLFFLEGVYIHLSIRTHVYGERKREIYFKELAHAIVDRLANPKSAGSLAEDSLVKSEGAIRPRPAGHAPSIGESRGAIRACFLDRFSSARRTRSCSISVKLGFRPWWHI